MDKEHSLIQSYVIRKWFVSTAHRQSSAAINDPPWYYETIVWEWDNEKKERGKMIAMSDGKYAKKSALKQHFGICMNLAKAF